MTNMEKLQFTKNKRELARFIQFNLFDRMQHEKYDTLKAWTDWLDEEFCEIESGYVENGIPHNNQK